MKWIATALLLFATAVFVVASLFERQHFWVGFVRAAAEAAMVGAIADWFAVTALFRHPLGLKIPHTAIIPRKKDSFGRQFGLFVQNNFLSGPVISARLRLMNVAQSVAQWMSRPENNRAVANFAAMILRGLVQVVKDEEVQVLIEHSIVTQARSVQITPFLGKLLSLLASGNRQKDLLTGGVKLFVHLLEENREAIQNYISHETPWWLPKTIDKKIYQRFVGSIEETLREVDADPDHPFHEKFDEILRNIIEDLKNSSELIEQGETWKEEFLESPAVQEFSLSLWQDIKTWLLDHSSEQNSQLRETIRQSVQKFAQAIEDDDVLLEKINRWLEGSVQYLINAYGHEVGYLIATTVSEWDAEATSQKIELQVGKDLQFIRINGTLVGGLVGLVIHTVSMLLL